MSVVIDLPTEEGMRTVLNYLSWKEAHFRKLLDVDKVMTLDDYYRHILDLQHVKNKVYDDLYCLLQRGEDCMSKIILFNSPRNVGKSRAITYLNGKGYNLIPAECKESLHKLTMTLFGVDPDRYWEIYNTRELKEVPLPEFSATLPYSEICRMQELIGRWVTKDIFGSHRKVEFTVREAMIYVSEIVVKTRWGNDWFGQERVRKMKGYDNVLDKFTNHGNLLFTDDSAAFVDELYPLIEYIGQENILLLRIHRDGFTFEGDSRNYIPDGIIDNTVDVNNNGTELEYFNEVEKLVKRFIDE